jgi:hypothetical protein
VVVTITGWPAEGMLEVFGLTQHEADHLLDVFAPIAKHVGIRYQWRRQGERITLTFTPGEGAL